VIYLIIYVTNYSFSHFCRVCKDVCVWGGGVAKCVQRHLRPPWLKMHTFIGSFFILLDARISFYLTKLCCHQSQKGEIESASRLLICFGDDDNHNLGGLMLLKRCVNKLKRNII
jgi:hypothetical protein